MFIEGQTYAADKFWLMRLVFERLGNVHVCYGLVLVI